MWWGARRSVLNSWLRANPRTPPVARPRIHFAILRCASSPYLLLLRVSRSASGTPRRRALACSRLLGRARSGVLGLALSSRKARSRGSNSAGHEQRGNSACFEVRGWIASALLTRAENRRRGALRQRRTAAVGERDRARTHGRSGRKMRSLVATSRAKGRGRGWRLGVYGDVADRAAR